MLRAGPFFFGKMKTEQQQLCEKEAAVRTKANGLDAINQTVGMIGYRGCGADFSGERFKGKHLS